MVSTVRHHLGPLAVFAVLVAWWLLPLAPHFSNAVPGAGPGDNLAFVWNVWWVRHALQHPGGTVLFTPLLLHPFGADLTQHTLALLPALAVSAIDNPILAQNLLIVAHVFLNFVCAYVLAYRETRLRGAAVLGALIFGSSPFVSAHLLGHFNLIAAWVIPLTALVASAARDKPSWMAGTLLGLVLGCTAYVDYYYLVYGGLVAVILVLAGTLSPYWSVLPPPSWRKVLSTVFLVALICDAVVIVWIVMSGGAALQVGSHRVSIRSVTNPVSAAWLVLLTWVLVRMTVALRIHIDRARLWSRVPILAAAVVTVAVILLPLILHAFSLWRAGQYASQRYFWRSAPSGIDLTTLALGNPFSLVYGAVVSRFYSALDVNLVENVGWVGPSVIVLSSVAIWRCRPAASKWLTVAVVFGIWSLGPSLEIAGHRTPFWLPATLVRWMPIVSNARIPARAIIVVYASGAVLSAYGFAWLERRSSIGRSMAALLAAVLVLDSLPQHPPLYHVYERSIDRELAGDSAPGAVLELPMGVRDGMGELGKFDSRVLYYQTIDHRPILGGFVARIPPSIGQQYNAMPIVGPLLRLSSGTSLRAERPDDDRMRAKQVLESLDVRFVVVTFSTSPADLLTYVDRVLPLRVVARDADHALYRVDATAAGR
ncbi:MAG TPA: hypothetical protein VH458_16105 [Vicinamibacterales bacterium]